MPPNTFIFPISLPIYKTVIVIIVVIIIVVVVVVVIVYGTKIYNNIFGDYRWISNN